MTVYCFQTRPALLPGELQEEEDCIQKIHHRRPQTGETTTKHSQINFLRHQQEARQEGRQKQTEGRQDGHNGQQEGNRRKTDLRQGGHNDQQEGRQEGQQEARQRDKTGDKVRQKGEKADTMTNKKGDKKGDKGKQKGDNTMNTKKGDRTGDKMLHGQRKRADTSSDRPGRQMNRNAIWPAEKDTSSDTKGGHILRKN